jgi:hypothetical protein
MGFEKGGSVKTTSNTTSLEDDAAVLDAGN